MNITQYEKPTDPPYPIMHGDTPLAKEFNKRWKSLWEHGQIEDPASFQQITTVLLEIFADEYNKRHAPRKKTSG